MKRRTTKMAIAAAIVFSLCLAVFTSAFGEAYSDMDTVLAVQEALNAAGYSCGRADGLIGSRTTKAISAYQRDQGLAETGTITDEVLASIDVLKDLPRSYTDADTILAVQEALNASGYSCGKADGLIGFRTTEAITAYQRDQGLADTGAITYAVLTELGILSPAVQPQDDEPQDGEAQSADSPIIGGRNMLLNALDPSYILYKGATALVTRGIAVAEWNAEDAILVQGTSGEHEISFILLNKPNTNLPLGDYTFSVYVKNNGTTPIQVGRGAYDTVAPGETKRAVVTYSVATNPYNLQIQFKTSSTGEDFDFIFWHPMVERGVNATDWTAEVDLEVRLENLEARLAAFENK